MSNSYKNRKSDLDLHCPVHGNFTSTYSNIIRTSICPKCGYSFGGNKQSLSLEHVRLEIVKMGYVPLFDSYKRAKDKLEISCSSHGKFFASYDGLKQGKRCPKCSLISKTKNNRLDIEEVKNRITKAGYLPKFESYSDSQSLLSVVCPVHGPFKASLERFMYGYGCQKCSKGRSKSQDEMFDFIHSLNADTKENVRDVIGPLELDVYTPCLNLAIEYCGLYWHSDLYKNRNYHFDKMTMTNTVNIRLITIFEDEWLERKDQVKGFLRSVLKKNNRKIFARKTNLKQVGKAEACKFLEENHIQGSCGLEVAFGLYCRDELVGVVTGNRHHRNIKANQLVLNRLAFKSGISVTGGSSKLLRALMEYSKNNDYSKIVSWSDNRWSEGNVYKKLGFELEEELAPDYSYVKKSKRVSKQSMTKNKLIERGAIGNTEREMAINLGYGRIWDCGKKRWALKLKR